MGAYRCTSTVVLGALWQASASVKLHFEGGGISPRDAYTQGKVPPSRNSYSRPIQRGDWTDPRQSRTASTSDRILGHRRRRYPGLCPGSRGDRFGNADEQELVQDYLSAATGNCRLLRRAER